MSKNILFIVHGMGVHGTDWATPVMNKLDEVSKRYQTFKTGNDVLSTRVKFVPITYDQVFQNLLTKWDKSATSMEDYITENGLSAKNIVGWLQGVSAKSMVGWLHGISAAEKNFFWSHVVDVFFYRCFDNVKREVRTRVMNDIVREMTREMQNGQIVSASILAHSLGTSVAHDCLAYLGGNPIGGSKAFMAGNFQFENIFMLANVGHALETNPIVYKSVVKPESADPGRAYCYQYYNFRHKFDLFPAVMAFNPVGWGDGYWYEGGLDHFHDFNVHDYLHYLDHPSVHIPIINGLVGLEIQNDEKKEAIESYQNIALPEKCLGKVIEFKEQLQHQIELIKNSKDPFTLIKAGVKVYAGAKEAYDACK